MSLQASQGPPRCYGKSFDANDKECKSCSYNWSCQNTFKQATGLPVYGQPQMPQQMPVPPQYGYNPPWPQQPQQVRPAYSPVWGAPPPTMAAPVVPRVVIPASPPAVPQMPMAAPAYMQQPQQMMVPVPSAETDAVYIDGIPMDPSAHILGQFPGEPLSTRFFKNITLRSVEAAFGEATRFVHYWRWPTLRKK